MDYMMNGSNNIKFSRKDTKLLNSGKIYMKNNTYKWFEEKII